MQTYRRIGNLKAVGKSGQNSGKVMANPAHAHCIDGKGAKNVRAASG